MKDYGFGYLAVIGAFITFVAIVAWSALPLIAQTAQRIEAIGR